MEVSSKIEKWSAIVEQQQYRLPPTPSLLLPDAGPTHGFMIVITFVECLRVRKAHLKCEILNTDDLGILAETE